MGRDLTCPTEVQARRSGADIALGVVVVRSCGMHLIWLPSTLSLNTSSFSRLSFPSLSRTCGPPFTFYNTLSFVSLVAHRYPHLSPHIHIANLTSNPLDLSSYVLPNKPSSFQRTFVSYIFIPVDDQHACS